jgi:hypothetical protein
MHPVTLNLTLSRLPAVQMTYCRSNLLFSSSCGMSMKFHTRMSRPVTR